MFASEFIQKGTVIFQEAPLLGGGPNWLQGEALFTLLPDRKKRAFLDLHSYCKCHQTPCTETPLMKTYDVNSYTPESAGLGAAKVYEATSRINHACIGNTARDFTKTGNIIILSVEDIPKDSELTIDYIGAGAFPVATRRKYLHHDYGFHCMCWACLSDRKLSLTSLFAQKKWFKPDQLANAEVLGEKTPEELAAKRLFVSGTSS